MKKSIVLSLLLWAGMANIVSAVAATNKLNSLCDEWHVLYEWFPGGISYYSTNTERLTGDTLIDGKHYFKLEASVYKGAIREDENAQIYIIPADTKREYLLYAFNSKVGDNLSNLWFGGNEYLYPKTGGYNATVADIKTENGHKTFILDVEYYYSENEKPIVWNYSWIDGVGLIAGPSGSNCPFACDGDGGTSVLCAYKDGEQIYTSKEAEELGCYYHKDPAYFPEGMTWSSLVFPWHMDTTIYHEIKVNGELTIDGTVYQNIGGKAVRTEGQKIYVYNSVPEFPKELLIYDFSMDVSDSIIALYAPEWYYNGKTRWHKVVSVDKVQLKTGNEVKRIQYDDGWEDIEYIGASNGDFFRAVSPLGPINEARYQYLCCSVEDMLYYEYTKDGCSYEIPHSSSGNNESSDVSSLQSLMNCRLSDNMLNITCAEGGFAAKVYSATGQLIAESSTISSELYIPVPGNNMLLFVEITFAGRRQVIKVER